MRTQQRSFVVEYKSKRRSVFQQNSIWGDTNLKALSKEVEALAPEIFAPPIDVADGSVLQKIVSPTLEKVDDLLNAPAAQAPGGCEAVVECSNTVARLRDQSTGKAATQNLGRKPSARRAVAKSAPRIAHEGRDEDELARLTLENNELKLLLVEKLSAENEFLRELLFRF